MVRARSGSRVDRAREAARRRTGTARGSPVRTWCRHPRAEPRTCSSCVAVRPAVRSRPAVSEAFPWVLRGSAHCTELSGLGDTAASFPAGGGPVREVDDASRTVRRRSRWRPVAAARGSRRYSGGSRESSGAKADFWCGELTGAWLRPALKMAECRWSSEVGPSVSRTSRRPSGSRPSAARGRLVGDSRVAGFRPVDPARTGKSTRPARRPVDGRGIRCGPCAASFRLGGRPVRGRPSQVRPPAGLPPRPAFARGACPSDVRPT